MATDNKKKAPKAKAAGKKTGLNREIHVSKGNLYPSKTSINFVQDDTARQNRNAILCFALFLVLLAAFVKFGIFGPMEKLALAEKEYNATENQLTELLKHNEPYNDVLKEYNEVVGTYLTAEEKDSVDRPEIFRMIEGDITKLVPVSKVEIVGKQISVHTGITTLDTVSQVISGLQSDKRNAYVTMTYTKNESSEENTDQVTSDMEITFGTDADQAQAAAGSDSAAETTADNSADNASETTAEAN